MTEQFRYTDERFADIQMLRYRLDGFEALTLRQKLYIYYLAKATLCGRDKTTDQFGRYNLRIRKVLEAIYERYEGDRTTAEYKALETYLKRVWFSNGSIENSSSTLHFISLMRYSFHAHIFGEI